MASDRSLVSAIEIYVRVAELRSFRNAASALSLTPSAVSKSVSRLEKRLGVKLLERSTRAVSPTTEGNMLLEHGQRALGEIEAAQSRLSHAREGAEGTVHIEATPFLGRTLITPALHPLLRRHAGLVVQLSLRDQPRDPGERGVDLSVRITPPQNQDLVVRRAGTLVSRALLCGSPAYFAAAGVPRSIEDLRTHACLGFVLRDQIQPWTFSTPEGSRHHLPRGPLVSTSKEILIEGAVIGLGIARLFEPTVDWMLKTRALETVLDELSPVEQVPIFVIRLSGRWLPRRTRVVFQYLLDLFASQSG